MFIIANAADDFITGMAQYAAALLGNLPVSDLPNTLIDYWNTGWEGAQPLIAPAAHFVPVAPLIISVGGLYALDVGLASWDTVNYCIRRLKVIGLF